MFYLLLSGVLCVSLAFFLYRLKREKKMLPDHSHIIFKNYSFYEKESTSMAANAKDSLEQIADTDVSSDSKQLEEPIETLEEAPIPTLHFQD